MHEYLKEAREGAAKKLKGIQDGEPRNKVDSSSWSPPEMLEADKQNGMRVLSPRQYKSGGKVSGIHAKKRVDRKARKEGGRAMSVDGFINRDDKMANDERKGVKKIGGMKRGGKAKREHHANGEPVGDMIRQTEIEENMKNRGIPARIPLPPRRPMDKIVKPKDPIPPGSSPTFKKGGATHPDVVADKALIKKMVKPSARTKHAKGGAAHPDVAEDKALIRKMIKPSARTGKAKGGEGRGEANEIKLEKMPSGAQQYMRGKDRSEKTDTALSYMENERNLTSQKDNVDHLNTHGKLYGAGKDNLDAWDNELSMKRGGRTKHASGGETGRSLYVRQGYPHEVPGVDGGRIARAFGGKAKGKGKTNISINVMPHGGAGQPPVMPLPIPVPPRPPIMPSMPPQAMPMGAPMGAPPMGGAPEMPPMGAGRPGMPPIGRKHGGEIPAGMKTVHVIDNAAGGGLGRIEKIKAYGLD